MDFLIIFYVIIPIIFAYFWLVGFTEMMLFDDSDFPGKNDKLIWGIAFVFLFFITPIAFYCWKKAYISYCEQQREQLE